MLGSCSALVLAWPAGETWSGTLVDKNCYRNNGSVSGCVASRYSPSFLLDSKGTMYELDTKTNDLARQAVVSLDSRISSADTPVFAGMAGHMNKRGHISADRLQVER